LIFLGGPTSLPAADTVYKFRNSEIPYSPYRDSILSLSTSEGVVSGQLRPLQGDDTPPIKVSGNEDDSVLKLQFSYPSGPERYVLRKREGARGQVIFATRSQSQILFRYKDSTFSDAALTFTEYECGDPYKLLSAELKTSPTLSELDAHFGRDRQLADLNIATKTGRAWSLYELLKNAVTIRQTGIGFYTPFGVEPYVAKSLRKSKFFARVDLDEGGCGASDRGAFVVSRDFFFDFTVFSEQKFTEFIDERLVAFVRADADGKPWNYRLNQKTLSRLSLPPYTSSYRSKVYAASEITRLELGWWDSFFVSFEPGELVTTKQNEYAVVVTVERLQSSKRSGGRTDPPDDTYFTKHLTFQEEAVLTRKLLSYFSRRGSL